MDKPQAEKMGVGYLDSENHMPKKKKKELKEWNKCFNPNNFITTVKFHTIWVKKENQ